MGGEILRCHQCRSRHAWVHSVAFSLPEKGVARGRVVSLAMLGSTFLVCFFFLWWMISRFAELAG